MQKQGNKRNQQGDCYCSKNFEKDTVTKKIPVDSLVKFHQEKIKSASEKLKKKTKKLRLQANKPEKI